LNVILNDTEKRFLPKRHRGAKKRSFVPFVKGLDQLFHEKQRNRKRYLSQIHAFYGVNDEKSAFFVKTWGLRLSTRQIYAIK